MNTSIVISGRVCNDCSFVTADVATVELGHPVDNIFGVNAGHLAKAYIKMMLEFNSSNKTLVRIKEASKVVNSCVPAATEKYPKGTSPIAKLIMASKCPWWCSSLRFKEAHGVYP